MRDIPSRQGAMGHMDKGAGCKIGARKGYELSEKKEMRKSVYEARRWAPRRGKKDPPRGEGESSRRGTEVGIDRRRKDCRDERGGSPAAQAPLRRRHIDSSGKSLQNGRRRSIPSLLFVRGRLPSI